MTDWTDAVFALLVFIGLVLFIRDMATIRQRQKRVREHGRYGLGRCLHCNRIWGEHSNLGLCPDDSGNFYT